MPIAGSPIAAYPITGAAPTGGSVVFTAAQATWHWSGNAGVFAATATGVQQAWHWAANAAIVSNGTVFTAVQQAWHWAANAPVVSIILFPPTAFWRWQGNAIGPSAKRAFKIVIGMLPQAIRKGWE